MDFKKIILGVIVVIILYLVYAFVFSDSTSSVLYSGGNAKIEKKIPASKLPGNKASVDFTFSIWINVTDWQYRYGEGKVIYRRIGNMDSNAEALKDASSKGGLQEYNDINNKNPSFGKNSVSPELSLGGATNDLSITMAIFGQDGKKGKNATSWSINNIPIQKWCNVIISTNNRAVDTYVDGKLVNTHVLDGVPFLNKMAPVHVTPDGGFSGYTSKFKYIARTISPREAYEIYREGPGGNWLSDLLNQYKLKFSFLKDNEEVNSFEL